MLLLSERKGVDLHVTKQLNKLTTIEYNLKFELGETKRGVLSKLLESVYKCVCLCVCAYACMYICGFSTHTCMLCHSDVLKSGSMG